MIFSIYKLTNKLNKYLLKHIKLKYSIFIKNKPYDNIILMEISSNKIFMYKNLSN